MLRLGWVIVVVCVVSAFVLLSEVPRSVRLIAPLDRSPPPA